MADTPSRKTLSLKPEAARDTDPDRQRSGPRAHRVARATVREREPDANIPSGAPVRKPRGDNEREAPGRSGSPRPERGAAQSRPPRGDRFERPQGADRPQRFERPERNDRPQRFERSEGAGRPPRFNRPEGADRPQRFERPERTDRPQRFEPSEGTDRPQRFHRPEGADRPQRFDRPERTDRPQRFNRPEGADRPQRFERPDRPQRFERGDDTSRPARFERGERPERFARPDRPQREERFERRPDRDAPPRFRDERPPRAPRAERHGDAETHTQRRPRAPLAETHAMFAPCPAGLEAALAAELQALGFVDAQAGRAGCRFTANWTGMMRANLHCRLATRILVQVAQGPVATEDDILALAYATPWERWFGAEQTLRVDTSAVRSPMRSLQYCNLRAKDGICDRLREREGARPSIDTVRPDARVHVFLDETTATLYLDTSGESLFKRGWRHDKGEAPLRENLAAGLLAVAGWQGDTALVDPFCGSGTILIEAAYIALRVPPGVNRPFAFERLRDHDGYLWRSLKEEARAAILPRLEIPLLGSDLDPYAIEAAYQNAERARLTPDAITFEVRDVRDIRPPEGAPGRIVTNPPYGERLAADGAELWADWAQTLKAHFDGWKVHVITTDRDLPRQLRLNAQRRTPLYNGALECRLFDFEIVGGSYRQKI